MDSQAECANPVKLPEAAAMRHNLARTGAGSGGSQEET
jgi:hypothetical protein